MSETKSSGETKSTTICCLEGLISDCEKGKHFLVSPLHKIKDKIKVYPFSCLFLLIVINEPIFSLETDFHQHLTDPVPQDLSEIDAWNLAVHLIELSLSMAPGLVILFLHVSVM